MRALSKMTSRERILAAIRREPVDYVPCVPVLNPLHERQREGYRYQFAWGPSQREKSEYLLNELGVDALLYADIPFENPAPGVSSRVWRDGEIIHKAYTTPAGELSAAVRYDPRWVHGFDIPFFSDFLIGHSVKHWIETERDVECLGYILRPPESQAVLEKLRFDFMEIRRVAEQLQLPISSQIGLGLTGGLHLIGSTEICLMAADNPEILHAYLELEHRLNLKLIDIAGDLKVDIMRRNGFYETADFYSPRMLHDFLQTRLVKEAQAARQTGAVTTYTVNTGIMPILDYLATLDFDCLDSIDIGFKGVDLAKVRDSQRGRHSFWIGPSSVYHIWKSEELTRAAVRQCFEVLGEKGLLITGCPSSHSIMPWQHTLAMIDEWKSLR